MPFCREALIHGTATSQAISAVACHALIFPDRLLVHLDALERRTGPAACFVQVLPRPRAVYRAIQPDVVAKPHAVRDLRPPTAAPGQRLVPIFDIFDPQRPFVLCFWELTTMCDDRVGRDKVAFPDGVGEPITMPNPEEDGAGRNVVAEHAAMVAERRAKM